MSLDDTFFREILDHHAASHLVEKRIAKPDLHGEWVSLKTGNKCIVEMKVLDLTIISRCTVFVEGSALAKACASIMRTSIEGRQINEAKILVSEIKGWMEEGISPKEWSGDLIVYQSLSRFPERMDCSLLGWRALETALLGHEPNLL